MGLHESTAKNIEIKTKIKKAVTIHRNRIFVVSILLQFQFVASRLVLDFSVGSFGVRCSCCRSAARRLGGVFVIGVGVGVGGIGCNLPLFFFFVCLLLFCFLKVHLLWSWPIFDNNNNNRMAKLELLYCSFRILFRAYWKPYMVFVELTIANRQQCVLASSANDSSEQFPKVQMIEE